MITPDKMGRLRQKRSLFCQFIYAFLYVDHLRLDAEMVLIFALQLFSAFRTNPHRTGLQLGFLSNLFFDHDCNVFFVLQKKFAVPPSSQLCDFTG